MGFLSWRFGMFDCLSLFARHHLKSFSTGWSHGWKRQRQTEQCYCIYSWIECGFCRWIKPSMIIHCQWHSCYAFIHLVGNSTSEWRCNYKFFDCCQRKAIDCSISSKTNRSLWWVWNTAYSVGIVFLIFDGLNFRKPCTIEWRYTAEGEYVRVSTRSGRIIPKSPAWEETNDYAKKKTYKRNILSIRETSLNCMFFFSSRSWWHPR